MAPARPELRRAVLGVQALQNEVSPERGIPRYVSEFARAARRRLPAAIDHFDIDPTQPLGRTSELPEGQVRFSKGAPAGNGPCLYHVLSPFEPRPLGSIWPAWARANGVKLVVTLYDLIVLIWEREYLQNWAVRQRYLARLGMLRTADAVLAISQQTADDAVRLLGIDRRRIFVVYAGVSDLFAPSPQPSGRIVEELQRRIPALRPGFFLYAGAMDHRKNLRALIEAYALLPERTRQVHQLVIVSRLPGADGPALQQLARRLGIDRQTVWTDYVPDETLARLYQACEAFVFPSLYEGFGLPVVEAQRCGAPVLAGDNSSLREIVPDEAARFDSAAPQAIAALMQRVATDVEFRAELARRGPEWAARFSWDRVVDATLRAYESVWEEAVAGHPDGKPARLEVGR
jgi:glycosyltransferase involved in cell wall biosynthesis